MYPFLFERKFTSDIKNDLTRHLAKDAGQMGIYVVCTNPSVQLGAVRKAWHKIELQLKNSRAATLNQQKRQQLTEIITAMQTQIFAASNYKKQVDITFTTFDNLPKEASLFTKVYITCQLRDNEDQEIKKMAKRGVGVVFLEVVEKHNRALQHQLQVKM